MNAFTHEGLIESITLNLKTAPRKAALDVYNMLHAPAYQLALWRETGNYVLASDIPELEAAKAKRLQEKPA